MYTLGIPKRDYRRATQVLEYESQPSIPFHETLQDDGFYLFTFPEAGSEDDFRDIVIKLKGEGIRVIGADSQLTESNIMKLANLIEIESDELDEINENLNPEVLRALDRFIKSMAKRYDYSERDAIFAIKAAMKQRDFLDSEDEENQSIDRPNTDIQEQKIRKLIHNELKNIS